MGYFCTHREAVIDQFGRVLEKIGQIHGAELFMQLEIAVERAGDVDRRRPGLRHIVAILRTHTLQCHQGTRKPAGIQTVGFAVLPHDGEHIAPQTTHHRLGHIDHRGHGQRSIRGISSRLQNIAPDHGGERCAGTGHAVAAINRRTTVIEGDWC